MSETKVDRRTFLNTAAGVVAGSAFASTALSYDRILGANDRISLGHIGIGSRGSGLHTMISQLKGSHNVETTAVCDLWTRNRAVTEHVPCSEDPLREWKFCAAYSGFHSEQRELGAGRVSLGNFLGFRELHPDSELAMSRLLFLDTRF